MPWLLFLHEEGVPVVVLPPYRCDLNPVKPIVILMKQRSAAADISFGSFTVLEEMPEKVWLN